MSPTDQEVHVPLVTVRCDLCGDANDRTLFNLSDRLMRTTSQVFRMAQCRTCDLIYLNPRPQSHDMEQFYPADYAPFVRRGLSGAARSWLYRRSVAELAGYLAFPNRVIDVGCGSGELLRAVREAGNPNVLGIEPSPQASAVASEGYGLSVRTGTLEQAGLPPHSVDTILLSHVIEHFPSPASTMMEIARVLRPGGAVIIWTPNARSFAARVLGQHWMGWDVPRHLYAFTTGTLRCLLERSGLRPVSVSHERHGLEWAWGLRLWADERLPGSGVNEWLSTIHPFLSAGLTPLGMLSAGLNRSGRIRVIARKPVH